MSGWVDLHCHYVPAVDDGVRTLDESVTLLKGLAALGYRKVVATPHIRTAQFDNRKAGLTAAFADLGESLADEDGLPDRGLAAEHYCDDVFYRLFQEGEALPYPGGKAALVEFHYDVWPQRVEGVFWEMQRAGVVPVLAHPERYAGLRRRTDPLDPLLDVGVVCLLDLMSLVGRYGRSAKATAERMLEEGVYEAACSDSHRPSDVERVERAIERLRELTGDEEAEFLLREGPQRILDGRTDQA